MYFSWNIIRVNKLKGLIVVGHVTAVECTRNAYKILVGMSEEERPLEIYAWIGTNVKIYSYLLSRDSSLE
jgi:hypothetical protein